MNAIYHSRTNLPRSVAFNLPLNSREGDGGFKVAFSELGRPPAYSGAVEFTLRPGERQVVQLPAITQPDGQGNLQTIVVICAPGLAKDQNGPLAI